MEPAISAIPCQPSNAVRPSTAGADAASLDPDALSSLQIPNMSTGAPVDIAARPLQSAAVLLGQVFVSPTGRPAPAPGIEAAASSMHKTAHHGTWAIQRHQAESQVRRKAAAWTEAFAQASRHIGA